MRTASIGVVSAARMPQISEMGFMYGRHDPTSVPPSRFVASVLVEWASDRVSSLPITGPMLRRVFDRTLRAPEDPKAVPALVELARALGDQGYFDARPWRTKKEMAAFVHRVVEHLRS